jgi:hypothetical protein
MQRQRRHREAEMSSRVISARLLPGDLLGFRLRVKGRRTQPEQMFSGVLLRTDIARRGQHVATGHNQTSPIAAALLISSIYRVIRPWLISTFEELTVYCRTTLLLSKKITSDFLSPSAPLLIRLT